MSRWHALRTLVMAGAAASLVALLVVAVGRADFRRVQGSLSSTGADWDTWRSAPTTCTLDPQDGRPPATSTTRLSLIWLDFEAGDQTRFGRWETTPDKPLRLDVIGWPAPDQSESKSAPEHIHLLAVLRTVKHGSPLLLDASVCSRLEFRTSPEPALVHEGRPALGGVLELDCAAAGRHISGSIQFNRCGF